MYGKGLAKTNTVSRMIMENVYMSWIYGSLEVANLTREEHTQQQKHGYECEWCIWFEPVYYLYI